MIFEKKKVLEQINKELEGYCFGEEPIELYEPISYILTLGGKRLRPVLTLFSAYLYGDDYSKSFNAALAIEVFHNFTLMHDDIMDNAPLRRNKPTVHEKWNKNIAVLSGDVMLVKAYELLIETETPALKKILTIFNKCAAEVCEGQQFDMNFETVGQVSEEDYLNMIRLKTAVLLGLSLEVGALLGGASDEDASNLRQFGINIGLAFQLKDDLLDVYGDQVKFGKRVGGDIASNKKTFLLIKALERAESNDKSRLQELIANTSDDEQKVKEVTALYDKLNIKELTEDKMNFYFLKGLKDFSKVKAPLYKKNMLKEYVMQLMDRDN